MKQRKTVRVAGPFRVEALIETYADNTGKVRIMSEPRCSLTTHRGEWRAERRLAEAEA